MQHAVCVCRLLVKDRSVLQGFHGLSQHRADITGLVGQSSAFIFVERRNMGQKVSIRNYACDVMFLLLLLDVLGHGPLVGKKAPRTIFNHNFP